jgi:hypothetical protein
VLPALDRGGPSGGVTSGFVNRPGMAHRRSRTGSNPPACRRASTVI